jgi:hypothetical protein
MPAPKARSKRKRRQKHKAGSAAREPKLDTPVSSGLQLSGLYPVVEALGNKGGVQARRICNYVPTNGNLPLSQPAEFYGVDTDVKLPPIGHLSLHGSGQVAASARPPLTDEAPLPPPFINNYLPFGPSLYATAPPSIPNALLINDHPAITMRSVEAQRPIWDDSYLTRYVRIPVWAKVRLFEAEFEQSYLNIFLVTPRTV